MTTKKGQYEKMRIEQATLHIVGESPLMLHRFSAKAAYQMLGKMIGLASAGRGKREPDMDFIRACQFAADGHFGISAIAFKCCAVRGAKATAMMPMTDATSAFRVVADANQCVPVFGTFVMDTSLVRNDKGTDIRFRPRADEWAAAVKIRFNANVISGEQLVQLFEAGGFGTGLGEWRIENKGDYGGYRIGTAAEVAAIRDRHEATHKAFKKKWAPLLARVEAEGDNLLELLVSEALDGKVPDRVPENLHTPDAFKKIADPKPAKRNGKGSSTHLESR